MALLTMRCAALSALLVAICGAAGAAEPIGPGDDFYRYVNEKWESGTAIPDGAAAWGARLQLRDDNLKRMIALVKAPGAEPWARKVALFHDSQLARAAIERRGLAPIRPTLAEIAALPNKAALARYLGRHAHTGPDPLTFGVFDASDLFGLHVGPGLQDPAHHLPYLLQGGLGLPGPDSYQGGSPGLAAYERYIAATLADAGIAGAAGKAQQIVALESRIASQHAAPEVSADLATAGQVWRRADFKARAGGIDWDAYLDAAGIPAAQAVGVWQAGAIEGIAALVASQPLTVWKSYLQFHAINANARFLPSSFSDRYFAFFDPIFIGPGQHRPWWDHVVSQTNAVMPNAGRLFAERHFTAESKRQVEAMVHMIRAAFERRLDQLAWMAPATRQRAKDKLAAMVIGVGHPAAWRDSSKLVLRPGDPFGNIERVNAAKTAHQLASIGRPVERSQWIWNAELFGINVMPALNAMTIPMTELQKPMFDPKAEQAENYGALGVRIARFIVLALDQQGSRFDAQGRFAPWWSAEDATQYRRLAQPLGNGAADLAGLAVAYDALRLARHGVDDRRADQRFFIAYAQSVRAVGRDKEVREQAAGRVHLVRHLAAWHDVFELAPGQPMYLAPAQRLRVW